MANIVPMMEEGLRATIHSLQNKSPMLYVVSASLLASLWVVKKINKRHQEVVYFEDSQASVPRKQTIKDVIADNPLLVEVALSQGISLEELCGQTIKSAPQPAAKPEPAPRAKAEAPATQLERTATPNFEIAPPASSALNVKANHPAVVSANGRIKASPILRGLDPIIVDLLTDITFLDALIAERTKLA